MDTHGNSMDIHDDGKNRQKQITYASVGHLLDYLWGDVFKYSLKALENYLDRFWSNRILVLLLESPGA